MKVRLYLFTMMYSLVFLPFRLLYAFIVILIGWSNKHIEEYENRFKDFTE